MKTLLGAVAGALAVGVVLGAYNLGERRALARDPMIGQMPYGQGFAVPAAWSPYSSMSPGATAPYGYGAYPQGGYLPAPQYVAQQVVAEEPVVRRTTTRRVVSDGAPRRSWQKSALLIGGSAGAGAGIGALVGGKKGAIAGAAIGGGTAAIYDQVKRH